jgi:hypothetical protein
MAYMESPNEFFGIMKRFMAAKDVGFEVGEELARALV